MTLSLGALFAEQLEWFTTPVNSEGVPLKMTAVLFNQALGSPHLIPGSRVAKWLLSRSAASVTALCFPNGNGSVSRIKGFVVSGSNARIPMQIRSPYADQSSPAQKVLFCKGRCDETIQRLCTRAKKWLPGRLE